VTALAPGDTLAVVARPTVGTVIRKRTTRGTNFALRVTFAGERVFVPLGGSWEGWTEERVQAEREHIARMIARGEWTPPDSDPPAAAPGEPPSFQVFASEWLERKRRRVGAKTHSDLLWRLTTGMDHFGAHRVDRIDEVVIEDFVQAMLAEREGIRVAAAAGHPLMQTVTLPDGRTYERRRRPLSNGSINKAIAAVRMVLKDARRRYPKHVLRNPAAERDVYLKAPPAARSFLEPHHIAALLEAAHQLDGRGGVLDWEKVAYIRKSDKSAVRLAREFGVSDVLIGKVRRGLVWNDARTGHRRQRRAIVGALVLAGPRISELCGLPDDRLDLAGGRILIPPRDVDETGPQTKTFAGERIIPMVPALRDILLDSRASAGARGTETAGPSSAAFSTRNGTPQTPGNIAHHVLAPTVALAEELLRARRQTPMPDVTPHTLRRTFASILAECGVAPRRAMYLLGHTDAKLTLSVYQQVLDMSGDAVETLEQVLGGDLDDIGELLNGRTRRRRRATEQPVADGALRGLMDGER
jgi:integrase